MTNDITHIALDMGGVVLHIDHDQAVSRFEEIGAAEAREYLNPYHQQGFFGQLEGGQISAETFVAELSRLIGKPLTHEQCLYAWLGYLKELPQRNLDAIQRLRNEGYRVCLLSNTNPFFFEWAESGAFDGHGHPIGNYFDSLYVSFRCKLLKPSREIYEHVLRSEGIRPEQLLFIDDSERNTEAAAALGIRTLHVETNADWPKALADFMSTHI
ncbi:MAG: HAD family phosphatase [Bacteroidales bacterium]|nr:HAD family phosphatase [Bacteroidales bacterium]